MHVMDDLVLKAGCNVMLCVTRCNYLVLHFVYRCCMALQAAMSCDMLNCMLPWFITSSITCCLDLFTSITCSITCCLVLLHAKVYPASMHYTIPA
jgi:hypothetical protein